jgi:hypothetical protein
VTDDPRAQAIEAVTNMFIGKWLAPDPYDDNDVEMVRQWAESAVDAIPGDVHAHLAQQKGALIKAGALPEGDGYITVYRLVDPPQNQTPPQPAEGTTP